MFTFGSLFAGIGGLDLGLERAGMQCRWQVEIDPYCRAVLAKHWPNVARFGDIRELGEIDLEEVDLIAGGFPCQPFSNAGKRRGVDDERWLWPEFARIVRLLRPRYVLVENVPGLLAGRGMAEVLGDLAALGFDAEWECIPAAAVGAPHLRWRVFIVAYAAQRADLGGVSQPAERSIPAGDGRGVGALADTDHERLQECWLHAERGPQVPDPTGRGRSDEALADAEVLAERPGLREVFSPRVWGRRPGHLRGWPAEPDLGRVANGVPSRVDRLRSLGNAVVPQVAEAIGRMILEFDQ